MNTAIRHAVRAGLFTFCPKCLGCGVRRCHEQFDTVLITHRTCPACGGTGRRAVYDRVVAEAANRKAAA